MSYQALPGPLRAAPPNALLDKLPALLAETRRRALLLMVGFAVIALLLLAVGVLLPKKYSSATTILVGEGNIIAPLMEGRAVPTGVVDRARIAREVIFSRSLMAKILEHGGWAAEITDPIDRERAIEQIKRRTVIDSPGPNLIRIAYSDAEPDRAFRVAQRYSELFIDESLAAKERESREAYEFIAERVDEYHSKLTDAEERLKQFRAENMEARPGSEADVLARVSEVRSRIEKARTDLAELQMRESALQGQISGEAEVADERRQSAQIQQRISEMNTELQRLLLDYTDAYPDVVRLRHQISDMQELLAREQEAEADVRPDAGNARSNPLYQELRSDLAKVRSDMAALRARINDNEGLLEAELDRGRRVADSEADLAELTRDYEVNRDLYQDLLRRRENARVSMSLDAERRGLTFRVQEPAALPLQPSGMRLLHFAGAGLVLGAAIPLGLLLLFVQVDPRARNGKGLAEAIRLPVLVSVPEYRTIGDQRRSWVRLLAGFALVGATLVIYVLVMLQRGGGSV